MKRLGVASLLSAVLAPLLAAPVSVVQTGPAGSGHWEGTIQLPNKVLKIAADFAQNQKGEWAGSLEIPEQKLSVAASNLAIHYGSVSFASREWLLGFEGNLSADGKSIHGGFISGSLLSVPVRMQLQWVSEAAVKSPAASTPISKDAEGTWEGVVTLGSAWEDGNPAAGSKSTVRLRLAKRPDGIATGVLTKSGGPQGEVLLSVINQKGTSLRFELQSAGVVYVGEFKDHELVGEWNQFGLDPVPVTLRRVDKK